MINAASPASLRFFAAQSRCARSPARTSLCGRSRFSPLAPLVLAGALLAFLSAVRADTVPMRDYLHLTNGMSEAEVLYRVGAPDQESVYTDYHHNVVRKIWYYIPARPGSNAWITEITFDHAGVVQALQRARARR